MSGTAVLESRDNSKSVNVDWTDDEVWRNRLRTDAERAVRHQTADLRRVTEELLTRAVAGGACSFALTGSTAVDRRTRVSDLDFYVVGPRPLLPETDEELDVYAVSPPDFQRRLTCGDDYLQWTLRFGLILHDEGPFRSALRRTAIEKLWPDAHAKAEQARRAVDVALAIIETGDYPASVEQARVAFSLAARWWLLAHDVFPRARADLPLQLRATPMSWLGAALSDTIYDAPSPSAVKHHAERLREALCSAAVGC